MTNQLHLGFDCKTKGGRSPSGTKCVFPFIWKGTKYTGCTAWRRPWCSTKTDSNNKHIRGNWGYCDASCQALRKRRVRVKVYVDDRLWEEYVQDRQIIIRIRSLKSATGLRNGLAPLKVCLMRRFLVCWIGVTNI